LQFIPTFVWYNFDRWEERYQADLARIAELVLLEAAEPAVHILK
jgi:hypothetical protein